ncbi:MAG: RidA family protein [Planctomycetes bacterium]|nr:RidA family protein [Planctomycetota bacterium]
MEILQPDDWPRPKGYANGILAEGRLVFVAGQIGWNSEERFESPCMAHQVEQALTNVLDVLAVGGAGPEHVVRMTWYVTDKHEYREKARDIGAAYRKTFGKHFPVMTLVQVAALLEDEAKVEIECTAVLPDAPKQA